MIGVPSGACVVARPLHAADLVELGEGHAGEGGRGEGDLVHDLARRRRSASGSPSPGRSRQTISHSCLPVFGAITGRTRLMRRSALVKVPSFSRNDVPGRKHVGELGRLVEEQVLHDEQVERRRARRARAWCWGRTGRCPRPARTGPGTSRRGRRRTCWGCAGRARRAVAMPHSCSNTLARAVVGDVAVPGQLVRERAHVARALHVVLAAQRVDADAVAPDVAGGHGQVGHAHHHGGALAVLGDAEAVVDGRVAAGGVEPGGGPQLGGGHPGDLLDRLRDCSRAGR